MAVGTTGDESLSARSAATQACHVRLGGRLVDEDEPVRLEAALLPPPVLAGLRDVGAVLLGGMERLFLKVSPIAARA